MSAVTPVQNNFNAGEISRRLRARHDLTIQNNAVAELAGWLPLMEGGLEACPGLLHVEQARGPCRLIPFDYSATQGHVIEASAGAFRVYTNDARIEVAGNPVEVAVPYDMAAIEELDHEQSFDMLYLFHRGHETRGFVRTGADSFALETITFRNGPFEDRNRDESLTVSASGVDGNVTLTASAGIFAAGDVGGLFKMEADDFGDIPSWEPGITVSTGALRTWNERVYRAAGGTRTGSVAPIHVEGLEWDGMGSGTDLNDNSAGGVQWEYLHDRIGLLKITGYTSPTQVAATVTRRLPFTASGDYGFTGGYRPPGEPDWTPEGVSYSYGTWRWAFGSFSPRRGFPQCGVLWGGRLLLAKDSTVYGSVVGDLHNHAKYNELGEVSADMAFVAPLSDANAIVALVASDRPLAFTAKHCYALVQTNQASPMGPGNVRADRQHSKGAAGASIADIDGRQLYIRADRRGISEADLDYSRGRQAPIDLTRYARHIGRHRFIALAAMQSPDQLIWAVLGNGTLAAATYIPEENVLGWARRPLADGMAAVSLCVITGPDGERDQLWVAATLDGATHVLRLADIRGDDDWQETAPMLDMAMTHDGAPQSAFTAPPFAGRTIQAVADGVFHEKIAVDAGGQFTLPKAAAKVVAGLPFPAVIETLPPEAGGDSGPAHMKVRRISKAGIELLNSRGLAWSVQGQPARDIGTLQGGDVPGDARAPINGYLFQNAGTHDRQGIQRIERVAPFQATLLAVMSRMRVEQQ